ncbi:MAG: hypothetical protein AAFY91_14740, partial [Bacteroidota bacterium]
DNNPPGDADRYQGHFEIHEPYAFQWLLESVQGPDYIDRNGNSEYDSADWGYWVKFDYSYKGEYVWRAPFQQEQLEAPSCSVSDYECQSFEFDSDDLSKRSFSWGIKQNFLLSRITTATHYAKFNVSSTNNRIAPFHPQMWSGNRIPEVEVISDSEFRIPGNYSDDLSELYNCDAPILERYWFNPDVSNPEVERTIYTGSDVNTSRPECGATPFSMLVQDVDGITYTYFYVEDDGLPTLEVKYVGPGPGALVVRPESQSGRKLDSIELYKTGDSTVPEQLVSKIELAYERNIRKEFPSSSAEGGGSLALTRVSFLGRNGQQKMPSYTFEYGTNSTPGTGLNPNWEQYARDEWGYYRDTNGGLENTSEFVNKLIHDKNRASMSAAWNMTSITTPLGSSIDIVYESDDFHYVNGVRPYTFVENVTNVSEVTGSGAFVSDFQATDTSFITEGDSVNIHYRISGFQYYHENDCYRVIEEISGSIVSLSEPCPRYGNQPDAYYTIEVLRKNIYGGGSRVSRIRVVADQVYSTEYRYEHGNGTSTGVATMLPGDGNTSDFDSGSPGAAPSAGRVALSQSFIGNVRSYGGPSPAVLYSKVTVLRSGGLNGKVEFGFYGPRDYRYNPGGHEINNYSNIYGLVKYEHVYENMGGENVLRRESGYEYSFGNNLHNYADVVKDDGSRLGD